MPLHLFELVGTEDDRPFSPYCWRTRMALAHKGLEATSIPWRFTERDALTPHKSEKVPVLLDPLTNRTTAGGDFEQAYWNQPLALHQAGVPFAMTGGDPLTQARFAVRHGLPAEAALAAITKAPAAILGVADRVGTLEAGKDADLVVLTGDPLNFTTTVRFTVIGGVVHGKED